MAGNGHHFIVPFVWKSSNMHPFNIFPERKKKKLYKRSRVGTASALIPSFPSPFPVPLDELYFSGSHFTTGEIPFVNLTSDSYKFFRVPRADVDGRPFLIRPPSVRRRRKYFRDSRGPTSVRKEQWRKGRIAMQPECASEGVTLARGRTSEYPYVPTSPWRGSNRGSAARGPHACHVPDVAAEGRFPGAPPANLAISERPVLHGAAFYEIRADSLPRPSSFPRRDLSISGDNIVHCRNGGIKHRPGETLNTRTGFIARWIAAHGARLLGSFVRYGRKVRAVISKVVLCRRNVIRTFIASLM